jgi:hypothetical protein
METANLRQSMTPHALRPRRMEHAAKPNPKVRNMLSAGHRDKAPRHRFGDSPPTVALETRGIPARAIFRRND